MYSVKEAFYTLQGEGAQAGRPAVFCRFTGCNLWNGKAASRTDAICTFCDTDFIGTDGQNGGKFADAHALVSHLNQLWQGQTQDRFVVLTGGEPALQVDSPLIETLHAHGYFIAIETNGTKALPKGIDWVCLSPKGASDVVLKACDELKLVFPQPSAPPERFAHISAKVRYLSPLNPYDADSIYPARNEHTQQAINYCLQHSEWRLTLQTHKVVGID
ncbi:7-carboxy-7-deazaguanine synthase [Salinibius halmophilus]|uniref:7-carboxy-7-deazaguanine synthase n=1 Tax=Salinibius halmophilus TaxID=1853216 RepID=UPI000E66BE69|nr:7-carboxy-7-deazaguanine synthase [Salinibius halmophilus]